MLRGVMVHGRVAVASVGLSTIAYWSSCQLYMNTDQVCGMCVLDVLPALAWYEKMENRTATFG